MKVNGYKNIRNIIIRVKDLVYSTINNKDRPEKSN